MGVTILVHVLLIVAFMWHVRARVSAGAPAGALVIPISLLTAAPPRPAADEPTPKAHHPVAEAHPASPAMPTPPPVPTGKFVAPTPEAAPEVPAAVAPAREMPSPPEPVLPVSARPEAATQAAPTSTARPNGLVTWESQVLAHLERNKRYPAAARLRRQEDVIYVRFTIDRQGQVSGAHIVRSKGFVLLDEEVLNLLARSVPLPAIPADVPGDRLELQVPVEFFMRGG